MDGIIVVNKEQGMTSHDVVFKLRKILKIKKIGHSGTLDPNATGVLVVLVGKACKILPFIEDVDKEYIACMELGKKTLSDDIWDEVLETKKVIPIVDFNEILQSFKGTIKQKPPMISSIKVKGKKLYEYARKKEKVEVPLRDVTIYDIEDLSYDDVLSFRVHCSSGTYVRSLCVDIAQKSGNLGCMSALTRSKVGRFSLEDAFSLSNIENGKYKVYSIEEMLAHLPKCHYSPIEDIYHGKKVRVDIDENRVVMYDGDKAIAVYERHHDNVFASVRGLW